jgi:methionyl-tRNA formyltransferase
MRDLNKEPVRILFLGTGWESVETLDTLFHDPRFNIVGVITQPDKKVGRKKELTPSKVKIFAIDNGIPVFHTEKNEEKYKEALDKFKPELVICKAFGEIVPRFFLEYPKYKAINIHFSLLPKYRGAVPIQKAILEGDKKTGITIMLMSEGLDEGDILEQFEEDILDNDTNQNLRERLVKKSREVLPDILEKWINGEIKPKKQENSKATYCWQKDISKENAEIDWDSEEPEYIERKIRAMIPWPVAWTMMDGKRMKIFRAEIVNIESSVQAGEAFIENGDLYIGTVNPSRMLKIEELQIEGKNKMKSKDYIRGLH